MWQLEEISITAALIGGFLSFFSPCILPLLPVYLSLITGLSISEISKGCSKLKTLLHTLLFISGFSTIYLTLGLGSSFLTGILIDNARVWKTIGGFFLILFGLLLVGVIKRGFLLREYRLSTRIQRIGSPFGAFLVGVGFAAGWSPCIGPILGSILINSSMIGDPMKSAKMLLAYSLGLAIPFMLSSLMINSVANHLRRYTSLFHSMNIATGIILIVIGLLMVTGVDIRLI